MQLIAQHPAISQRELAARMGVSLGKVNYCMQALVAKGAVKIQNFRGSTNKTGYIYLLTPEGVARKTRLTLQYLRLRMQEYDALHKEITALRLELNMQDQLSCGGNDF